MSGISRVVGFVLAFLVLVGLFVFLQKDGTDTSAPAPDPSGFEPSASDPQLVQPDAAMSPDQPAPAANAGTSRPQPGREAGLDARETGGAVAVPPPPVASPGLENSGNGLVPMPSGSAAMLPGDPRTTAADFANTPPEMVSLPPSGAAPESGGVDFQTTPPEEGDPGLAIAPEAGSEGVPISGPELLPVTHPGPSGEMPGVGQAPQ